MKKLILPMLLGIFALFFSGKPVSHNKCGPTFIIDEIPVGFGQLGILRVYVRNWTTGTVATYQNPTFPIIHVGTGGDYRISAYFDAPRHVGIRVASPCYVENLHDQIGIGIDFPAFSCDEYFVGLSRTDSRVNLVCN